MKVTAGQGARRALNDPSSGTIYISLPSRYIKFYSVLFQRLSQNVHCTYGCGKAGFRRYLLHVFCRIRFKTHNVDICTANIFSCE